MRTVLVLGRRRQGKTTLALYLALKQAGGVAVYDIAHEDDSVFDSYPSSSDLAEFEGMVSSGDHRVICYRPLSDVHEEFGGFAEILWRRQSYTLLLDEASQLQSAGAIHPALDRLVRMAPPNVRIIQTMHRPRDSNTLCRGLATDWFLFRTTLPRDIDVVREHCGDEAASSIANFVEGSRELYHWDDSLGRGEIWRDGSLWRISGGTGSGKESSRGISRGLEAD